MRRSALLLLVSVVLVACAEDPAPTGSRERTPPSADPIDATRLDIYESLARELVGAEAIEWKRIVIVSELCENAGEPQQMRGCDDSSRSRSRRARRSSRRSRADDLVRRDPTSLYDEEWFNGAPEIIVLRLGTIEETERRRGGRRELRVRRTLRERDDVSPRANRRRLGGRRDHRTGLDRLTGQST